MFVLFCSGFVGFFFFLYGNTEDQGVEETYKIGNSKRYKFRRKYWRENRGNSEHFTVQQQRKKNVQKKRKWEKIRGSEKGSARE